MTARDLVVLAARGELLAGELRDRLQQLEAWLAELVPPGHDEAVLREDGEAVEGVAAADAVGGIEAATASKDAELPKE